MRRPAARTPATACGSILLRVPRPRERVFPQVFGPAPCLHRSSGCALGTPTSFKVSEAEDGSLGGSTGVLAPGPPGG